MSIKHIYKTKGTCCKTIELAINDEGIIQDVKFDSGCPGNLQGIAKLVKGMKAEDVIERLKGIKCGNKTTSCPDQLANAVEESQNRSI